MPVNLAVHSTGSAFFKLSKTPGLYGLKKPWNSPLFEGAKTTIPSAASLHILDTSATRLVYLLCLDRLIS